MTTHRPALGSGLVILGATLFTINAGISRVALRAGVDAAMLSTIRSTFTFATLALIAVTFRRSALKPPTGRQLALVVTHGLVGVAALQWTYFVAIDRLPVGMALLLEYQAPILVALWARIVLRERVNRTLWLGLALAVSGLAAATQVWHGARFDSVGIAAGVTAAVCFATYFVVGETAMSGPAALDPFRLILWSFGVATLALNLVHPLFSMDTARLGHQVSLLGTLDGAQVPLWATLVWVVVLGTVIPFFVELFALSFVAATTVTVIAMLEPIGVSALGWAWFGETLGPVAIAGCIAVVVGIVIAQSARVEASLDAPVLT